MGAELLNPIHTITPGLSIKSLWLFRIHFT